MVPQSVGGLVVYLDQDQAIELPEELLSTPLCSSPGRGAARYKGGLIFHQFGYSSSSTLTR